MDKNNQIQRIADLSKSLAESMKQTLLPTQASLEETASKMSRDELMGIYYYGSKRGKILAKTELLKRGQLKESLLDRLIKIFSH